MKIIHNKLLKPMKNKTLPLLLSIVMIACVEPAFIDNDVAIKGAQKPSNLSYSNVENAREFSRVVSSIPTVNVGTAIPVFEIMDVTGPDGASVHADSVAKYISIGNAIIKELEREKENGYIYNGDTINIFQTNNLSNLGVVSIKDGNPFTYGDYIAKILLGSHVKEIDQLDEPADNSISVLIIFIFITFLFVYFKQ